MMCSPKTVILGAFCATSFLVVLLLVSCSVVTAPFRLPGVVAENASFSLDLAVVDQNGQPLEGVLLAQHLAHRLMHADGDIRDTNENKAFLVSREFSVHERGVQLDLTFTKDGYYDAHYALYAARPDTIHVRYPYYTPSWPVAGRFPIVLVARNKPDANIRLWKGDIGFNEGLNARSNPLYVPALWGPEAIVRNNPHYATNVFVPARRRTGQTVTANLDMVELFRNDGSPEETVLERFRPGTFYLTAVEQAPRILSSHGEVDPAEVDLPGQLTLHLSGADAGFSRIPHRLGLPTIALADLAPTTGYTSELVIDRKRLKEMRSNGFAGDPSECFFLKVDGHYGKGRISWENQYDPQDPRPLGTSLNIAFFMQSEPGNTNLTWYEDFQP